MRKETSMQLEDISRWGGYILHFFKKNYLPYAYIPQQELVLLPEKKTTKSKNEFTAYLKNVF